MKDAYDMKKVLKLIFTEFPIGNILNIGGDLSAIEFVNLVRDIMGEDSRELDYVCSYYNVTKNDIPSTIDENGNKRWYLKEKLHREDGPAVEYPNGSKSWYIDGQRHRLDSPAIEDADGSKYWYLNGQRHRIDGPAIEWAHGTKQWHILGKEYNEEEYKNLISLFNSR